MSADESTAKGFSLKRWSQRKLAATRGARESAASPVPVPAPTLAPARPAPAAMPVAPPAPVAAATSTAPPAAAPAPTSGTPAADSAQPSREASTPPPVAGRATDAAALPSVESLTIESDFAPFLQPKVDEALKRQALKQLFRDPRFNVMDGLDVYVDDYSKPDPIAPDLVRQLVQARYVFDPPPTRVNALGEVEDVAPDDATGAHAETETDAMNEARIATPADLPQRALAEPAPGAPAEGVPAASRDGANGRAEGDGAVDAATSWPAAPRNHSAG